MQTDMFMIILAVIILFMSFVLAYKQGTTQLKIDYQTKITDYFPVQDTTY